MRSHPTPSIPWNILGALPLAAFLYSGAAQAAEPVPAAASPAGAIPPAVAPTAPAPAAMPMMNPPPPEATPPPAAPTSDPPPPDNSSLAVERLPPSAWPAPKTRGIHGGSLWLSPFHGLQWPYIPKTGVGVSGSAWLDTGVQNMTYGPYARKATYRLQQGRAVIRVTPTYSPQGRFFVQAQGELVGDQDQSTSMPRVGDTDDLWLRVGMWKLWDIQVGRYEAWEIYHLGMGMDLNTLERQGATPPSGPSPPDFYGATFGFYRASSVGNVAFHAYPTDFLRFELLGHVGNDLSTGLNTVGGRPAAILDFGIIRVKGAAEYRVSTPRDTDIVMTPVLDGTGMPVLNPDGTPMVIVTQVPGKTKNTEKGFSGSVQLILDPYFEMGVNAAQGYVRKIDQFGGLNTEGTYTVTSLGGFANVRLVRGLIAGLGLHWTTLVDEHLDPTTQLYGYFAHLQTFFAIQYLVSGQLFVKAVIGYARGDIEPSFQATTYDNTMLSGRLRLMYLF